jgi:hypothetical protein
MLRERGWTVPKATTFGTCDLAGMRDGDTPTLVESALGALRKLRKPTRPAAASTGDGRDRRAAGIRRDRGQSRPGTVTQAA